MWCFLRPRVEEDVLEYNLILSRAFTPRISLLAELAIYHVARIFDQKNTSRDL